MVKKILFFLVACGVTVSAAMAQQMYKTIGKDGKITFSDRPAYESTKKLSVMHAYTLRQVELDKAPAEGPTKKADAATATPSATVTPEVEEAMVTVMGLVEFERVFQSFCNASLAGAKAFRTETGEWRRRNAQYVEQQKRLLMEVVSPNKRAELQSRTEKLMAAEVAKIAARPPASRQEWCEGVIAELASGRSDMAKPAMLAVPITRYRAQ